MSEYIVRLTLGEETRRWISRVLVTALAPKDSSLDEMDNVVDWLMTGRHKHPGPQDAS